MPNRNATVQSLKAVIEQRLRRMLAQNPLRTDFQQRYEEIVEAYNREKDRVTIERIFEELLQLGLPAPAYTDRDVNAKVERVYRHIHYAYPQLPSPVYSEIAA